MDMRFRFQQNQDQNRRTLPQQNKRQTSQNPAGSWQQYARKTQPPAAQGQPQRQQPQPQPRTSLPTSNASFRFPQTTSSLTQPRPSQKSSLSRYYRMQSAPKTQFKHYLSNITNVFYQDRQSLKQLSLYRTLKNIISIGFLFLLLLFICLHFIRPFQGICPEGAKCGVYVHCEKGMDYDKQSGRCVLGEGYGTEIEDRMEGLVIGMREDWAKEDCEGRGEEEIEWRNDDRPQITVREIVKDIGDADGYLRDGVLEKVENFFSNKENQDRLDFQYDEYSRTVSPKTKKYSLFCSAKLFFRTSKFKFGLPLTILAVILLTLAFLEIRRRIIAKKIYNQLKNRTFKQKLLNISYAKADVQNLYGPIDEKMWELIDGYRSEEKDIGFLQDDFLYWKLLQ